MQSSKLFYWSAAQFYYREQIILITRFNIHLHCLALPYNTESCSLLSFFVHHLDVSLRRRGFVTLLYIYITHSTLVFLLDLYIGLYMIYNAIYVRRRLQGYNSIGPVPQCCWRLHRSKRSSSPFSTPAGLSAFVYMLWLLECILVVYRRNEIVQLDLLLTLSFVSV